MKILILASALAIVSCVDEPLERDTTQAIDPCTMPQSAPSDHRSSGHPGDHRSVDCTPQDDYPIVDDVACPEQAAAWCSVAGFGGSGCSIVYSGWCMAGARNSIMYSSQVRCLRAIGRMVQLWDGSYAAPAECQATW